MHEMPKIEQEWTNLTGFSLECLYGLEGALSASVMGSNISAEMYEVAFFFAYRCTDRVALLLGDPPIRRIQQCGRACEDIGMVRSAHSAGCTRI